MTSPQPPVIVDGVDDDGTAMARSRRLGSKFTRRFSTRRKDVMAAILKAPSEESVNVPLAVIALIVALWKVPESRDEGCEAKRDVLGTLLTVVGLGALVFGLIESDSLGFGHPLVLAALVGGIVALAAFLLVEARLEAPLVPLALFRSLSFSGTNLLTFLLYAAFGGITFLLPFNLIQVQGYPPVAAGAVLIPYFLLILIGERAVHENELSISTAPVSFPASQP